MRALGLCVALALVPSCKQIFGIDGPTIRPDAQQVDAAIGCALDIDCPPAAPRCAVAQGICVECLGAADCTDPAQPLCAEDTLSCRGCLEHSDCESAACLPDGTCGDDATVLYVDATGTDNSACSFTAPCGTITHAHTLVSPTRRHVKLSGVLSYINRVTVQMLDVVWLAEPGTTFTAEENPAIDINNGARLTVYDLDVHCQPGKDRGFRTSNDTTLSLQGVRIRDCRKFAIEANGDLLIIDRSYIVNNGAGIDVERAFSITNTFFVRNGSPGSGDGAVMVKTSVVGQNRFEFNTVVDNFAGGSSTSPRTAGVQCNNSNTMTMPHNIIARNDGYRDNTYGGCDFSKSLVTTDVAGLAFVSPDAAPYDYHLTQQSVAIDAASASTLTSDFDGDARPQGGESDLGADEFKP